LFLWIIGRQIVDSRGANAENNESLAGAKEIESELPSAFSSTNTETDFIEATF
jgi:hypothetical protein